MVRKIGGQLQTPVGFAGQLATHRVEHLWVQLVFIFEGIRMEERDVIESRCRLQRESVDVFVDLHRDDMARMSCEEGGHPAGASADLEGHIAGIEFGMADDELDQVQIDQKILAEIGARVNPIRFEQPYQVRASLAFRSVHRRLLSEVLQQKNAHCGAFFFSITMS